MSSGVSYDFEWDLAKAISNFAKHGVTFEQAATVFLDPLAITVFDKAHSQIEERWFTVGHKAGGGLLVVVHIFQEHDSNIARVRIISARIATKQERRTYEDEPR
jgi:uncharacterized protein